VTIDERSSAPRCLPATIGLRAGQSLFDQGSSEFFKERTDDVEASPSVAGDSVAEAIHQMRTALAVR
jgi:hypothetical protein